MTNYCTSAPSASIGNNNIVPIHSPRASSLAVQSIIAAGVTVAEESTGRALAGHARFATAADGRRWKVKPGEVFAFIKQSTLAAERGAGLRSINRHVAGLKAAGELEIRQVSRTCRAVVFTLRAGRTAGVASGVASGVAVREPRTDPRGEPTRARVNRATPRSPSDGEVELVVAMAVEAGHVRATDEDAFRSMVAANSRARVAGWIGKLKRRAPFDPWRPANC